MDSDDDLIIIPKKPVIVLDDSDDDLLIHRHHQQSKAIVLDSDDDLPMPPPAAAAQADRSPASKSLAAHKDPKKLTDDRKVKQKVFRRKEVHKEGFLFKQQCTWPYSNQKRWCVLRGRVFTYYDNQGATKPSEILDLKGAKIILDPKDAKEPNSFALTNISDVVSGSGPAMKGRVNIFSTLNKETKAEWVEAIKEVLKEQVSEVHWFEKMAHGVY